MQMRSGIVSSSTSATADGDRLALCDHGSRVNQPRAQMYVPRGCSVVVFDCKVPPAYSIAAGPDNGSTACGGNGCPVRHQEIISVDIGLLLQTV
jgi:hypothetical protein